MGGGIDPAPDAFSLLVIRRRFDAEFGTAIDLWVLEVAGSTNGEVDGDLGYVRLDSIAAEQGSPFLA